MEIGKIFVRSIVGIITAGVVTVLVGDTVDPNTLMAMYAAIGVYVYLDKDTSGDIPE